MKFTVTMKTPDALDRAIEEAAEAYVDSFGPNDVRPREERHCIVSDIKSELKEFASKWVKHGEYITIEFDMEAGTATVQEAER